MNITKDRLKTLIIYILIIIIVMLILFRMNLYTMVK